MIIIRFADAESKRSALGHLVGRFSFKSWASGEMMLPKDALALLADEGIRLSVEGPNSNASLDLQVRDGKDGARDLLLNSFA